MSTTSERVAVGAAFLDEHDPGTEWRSVPGYEGMYDVSSDGQVRSLPRLDTRGHRVKGCLMKPMIDPFSPYPAVHLRRDGERHSRKLHALVALAFFGSRPDGMEVRHLDGNPLNNRVGNLAYGTRSENALDKVRHGTDHNLVKTHCPAEHPLSGDNLYIYDNRRNCRTCRRADADRYRQRQRERRAAA